MLLQSVAYDGFWWIPGRGGRVPGILEYTPEGGTRLKLNGSFEPTTFRSFGGGEVRHELVHGTTNLGKQITLVDCVEDDGTFPVGDSESYAVSEYRTRLAFVGEHFATPSDIRFTSLMLAAPNLTPFVATSGIRSGPPSENGSEHTLVIAHPEEFSFRMGDFRVDTTHRQTFGGGSFNRREIVEEAFLMISADAPCSLETFLDSVVRSVHTMLELVSDAPLPISELTAMSAADNQITVLRSQRRPKEVEEIHHPGVMPFTLQSLGTEREAVMGRWHEARQRCGPTFDLYFSVMRNADMPVEHRFLFLVQALAPGPDSNQSVA